MEEKADGCWCTCAVRDGWHETAEHPIGDLIGFRIGDQEEDERTIETVFSLQENVHLRSFLVVRLDFLSLPLFFLVVLNASAA